MPRKPLTEELRWKAKRSLVPNFYAADRGKAYVTDVDENGSLLGRFANMYSPIIGFSEDDRPKKLVVINEGKATKDFDDFVDSLIDLGERFLAAAEDADAERLETLSAEGGPVNYHDPRNGATALHYVGAQGARPALRALLKTGRCDFLARDGQGRLASELAGLYGRDLAMERLLLKKEISQAREYDVPLDQIYRRDAPSLPSPFC
jgi:hypothetical protein